MIDVKNTIQIYEINGKECFGIETPKLIVSNHWNQHSMVILKIGRKKITVAAEDLSAAIANAINTKRF